MLLVLTKKIGTSLAPILEQPLLGEFPFEAGTSRLNYKPDLFKFSVRCETIADLLKMKWKPLQWKEACEKRATELLAMGKNRYILSYSGGIDSTSALISMLKYWPAEEHRKIFISMTETSILENPTFFDKYVSPLNILHAQAHRGSEFLDDNSLFITGELGDQLFGSDILSEACEIYGDECLRRDYRELVPDLISKRSGQDGMGDLIFERIAPIVDECPFPIKTLHDFFWWFNFTQKWQHVKYRYCEKSTWDLSIRYGTHVTHFFDTIDFQQWSLANHDLKIGKTWDTYKLAAREYIYDFTKNRNDLALKKVQSLKRTYFLSRRRAAVTDGFKSIDTIEELRPYVRNKVQ